MTYSVILLVPRKQGVTPADFKHHWETGHVPLLKKIAGYDFPLSHTRHYIERTEQDQPSMAIGAADYLNFDGIAVLTFANKEDYGRFMGKVREKKADQKHEEDLERFVDVKGLRGVLVGETRATGRDGGMVGWRFVGSV